MPANSYSPHVPVAREQIPLFEKRCQPILLSPILRRFLKDIEPLGHGLSWTSLEFLVKELLHLSFLLGIFHAFSVTSAVAPATIPSRVSLFSLVELRIVSCSMVSACLRAELSHVIAIELRERSPRQASQFQDKARHLNSASVGACRRPTLGLGPRSVSPHSCSLAVCAGSATSCRSLLDLAVSKRLL